MAENVEQGTGAGTAAPQHPVAVKQLPELQRLADWFGSWTTEEKYEAGPMMPSGGRGTGQATLRRGPAGMVVEDYRSIESPLGADFEGHSVITFDRKAKEYLLFWFDSMSLTGEETSRGTWEGDKLVFTGEGGDGEKRSRWKMTYSFGPGLRVMEAERSVGGAPLKKAFSITYRKEGATKH